jgi:sterol 3beta-glucosyltransferase
MAPSHISTNTDEQMSRQDRVEAIYNGNTFKFFQSFVTPPEEEDAVFETMLEACRDADVIVANAMTLQHAMVIGDLLGKPVVLWFSFPYHSTSEAPNLMSPLPKFSFFNRLSHNLINYLTHKSGPGKSMNRWRQQHGLEPIVSASEFQQRMEALPAFYAYDSQVGLQAKDWPKNVIVGGWILDQAETELGPELSQFISKENDKSPVVYIGFGSMPIVKSEKFPAFLEEFAGLVNGKFRIVLFVGGSTPGVAFNDNVDLDDRNFIFPVVTVSHAALFPSVDLVVHHGGSGTTAAALHSGTPSTVVACFGDQPYWGEQTRKQFGKCAPEVLTVKTMTPQKLLRVIEQGLKMERKHAQQIASRLKKDAYEEAIKFISEAAGTRAQEEVSGH